MSWTFYNAHGHKLSSSAASVGVSSRVKGFIAENNTSAPTTQLDMSAAELVLRNPADGSTITRYNTGVLTNDLSVAGPTANGRDQSDAFDADGWVHYYFIDNGTTTATISSAALPSVGLVLPSGYTHWVYATSLRRASSNLLRVSAQGAWVNYLTADATTRVLAGGVSTSFVTIGCSTFVPPVSRQVLLRAILFITHSSSTSFVLYVTETGIAVDIPAVGLALQANQTSDAENEIIRTTDLSQQISYKLNAAPDTAGGAFIDIAGYKVPNGDS